MAELNADNENILKNDSNEMIKMGIDNSDNVSLEGKDITFWNIIIKLLFIMKWIKIETIETGIIDENNQSKETLGENLDNPPEIESQVDSADGRRRNKINNNTYVAKKTAAQGEWNILNIDYFGYYIYEKNNNFIQYFFSFYTLTVGNDDLNLELYGTIWLFIGLDSKCSGECVEQRNID